jgi:hypothetical protein
MRFATAILTAFSLAAAFQGLAQERKDPAEPAAYRVEFVIRDSADAAKSPRRFALEVEAGGNGSLRTGVRVPYAVSGSSPAAPTQYQYADVGTNIDCRLRKAGTSVLVTADVEVSTVAPPEKGAAAVASNPSIAQTKVHAGTAATPGKPNVIAVIDDPATKHKLEIEVLLAPVR